MYNVLLLFLYILNVITYTSWVVYKKKQVKKISILGYFIPIILLFKRNKTTQEYIISFLIIYLWLFLIDTLVMYLTDNNPGSGSIMMAIFLLFELLMLFFIISSTVVRTRFLTAVFSLLGLTIIIGTVMNFINKSNDPLNMVVFYTLLIKITALVFVVGMCVNNLKLGDIESLFILMGFLAFFMLQLFNTILLLKKPYSNWDLYIVPLIFVFIFWEASFIWISKLKLKYSPQFPQ